MPQIEFDTFIDVSYESDEILKTPEIIEREISSLVILPMVRLPLPHETVMPERLLPHEQLGGHWLEQRRAKWSVDYLGLHPLEPWQEGSSKPIRPLPGILGLP